MQRHLLGFFSSAARWFFANHKRASPTLSGQSKVDWWAIIIFFVIHVICLGVFWVGYSAFALWFAMGFYLIRMFGITAFYHRYFSHHAFVANRGLSFFFGFMGASAMQSGPLWWASIHRHHHKYSDTPKDIHSPKLRGFWWSHIGWIFSKENKRTRIEYIKDWLKYPELVLLDQMAKFVPIITGVLVFYLGVFLQTYYPELGTNGLQLLIWGFFVSTVFCSHATFSINSIDHMFGTRRYNTSDTSRNNAIMAMLTLGEGWHNNHHHHPITARAGFYWWEIDITYYLLVVLSWLGVVKNLRILPEEIRGKNTIEN